MLFKKWLPWKFIIKRAARAYGFLDPITLMARLRRFGQPSEVHEPIELIRAGMIFHARGLINTRAIQYNLDWVWPFWIVKQFKPNDISFIPRGFSFSHINLTHRNWTAVGHPDMPHYPIVDPRGLVTPHLDGWSIDCWIVSRDGVMLIPSETDAVRQTLDMDHHSLSVSTHAEKAELQLDTTVWVDRSRDNFRTHLLIRGRSPNGGYLVLAVRPYNPEGIQFIDTIAFDDSGRRFRINGTASLQLDRSPQKVLFSNYEHGDVARLLDAPLEAADVACDIGMATAAALFPIEPDQPAELAATLPLVDVSGAVPAGRETKPRSAKRAWQSLLSEAAQLSVPNDNLQFLYDAAVRTLLLLTAKEVYPGPYTYKRFWFRDACLMINALLGIGLSQRAARLIRTFPKRQTLSGYFQSQEGEWDSNGQVLWITGRLHALTGIACDDALAHSIFKGADWIIHKRLKTNAKHPHNGLLPAGFSAEHLGPNDYYYWDNFWGVAGLRAAARLAGSLHLDQLQDDLSRQADAFHRRVMESIDTIPADRRRGAIPASPYRRMDAGAVGSLVADYPLGLLAPKDPLIMNTAAYLMKNCFRCGAFFQDMIHAGVNIYLTLAIGQTLLRAGDPGYRPLIRAVADLASPTGQWPEAIHPFTGGGCMGDGQHGWAAAEWLMMMRNLFVREEDNAILIGSGVFPEWIASGRNITFGPTPVPGGQLSVSLRKSGTAVILNVDGDIAGGMELVAAIPGYTRQTIEAPRKQVWIKAL